MAFTTLGTYGTSSVSGAVVTYSGALIVYSSVATGELSNMAADISAPQRMMIQSTLSNDTGKDSSYLLKLQDYVVPPAGSPYGSPDPMLQSHIVVRGDTSVFTEAQIKNQLRRISYLLNSDAFVAEWLRGSR